MTDRGRAERLQPLKLSADFVLVHAVLLDDELSVGHHLGYFDAPEVVTYCTARLESGPTSDLVESLALLLSDQHSQVDALLPPYLNLLSEPDGDDFDPSRHVWLYLSLVWLTSHRPRGGTFWQSVEEVIADFGMPRHVHNLLPFRPVRRGEPVGDDAMNARLQTFIEANRHEYFQGRRSLE